MCVECNCGCTFHLWEDGDDPMTYLSRFAGLTTSLEARIEVDEDQLKAGVPDGCQGYLDSIRKEDGVSTLSHREMLILILRRATEDIKNFPEKVGDRYACPECGKLNGAHVIDHCWNEKRYTQ